MVLHWLIAAGVIANWLIRRTAKATESEEAARAIMSNHFSIGVTLWFLAIALLVVHFTGGKAPLATHLATWERWLARIDPSQSLRSVAPLLTLFSQVDISVLLV